MLPLGTIANPEIVIGLVGRMGLDTKIVTESLSEILSLYNYRVIPVKLTSLLPSIENIPEIIDHPQEVYYKSRIEACNKLREISERNDILACLAIIKIREHRAEAAGGTEDKPQKRVAYVIDQIKRPEETELLRQVYRDLYIQISCHAPREVRERRLAHKISSSHAESPREDAWRAMAATLIAQDDAEEEAPSGQRVREVFPRADVIINASDEGAINSELNRFFEIFFGCPTRSPTLEEFGMALAFNASLRSIDMSRQVGAAVVTKAGETLALGCNEVPKAGGGIYWEGDAGDARDASLGEDQNTRRKRMMVTDVVFRMANSGLVPERYKTLSVAQLAEELIDRDEAPLRDSLILDSLEFGRMLHAEMCAITEAARIGISLKNHWLFCTAFPCHNCAKHIVGTGIDTVIYLQPYPKSHVSELYPDSIEVDPASRSEGHVAFKPFVGVTPARYYLFEKERLKDDAGRIKRWSKPTANPISRQAIPLQSDIEKFALHAFRHALQRIKSQQHHAVSPE